MKPYSRPTKYSSLVMIVVAAFAIHGSVMGRFWLADDPQVLLHAERYGPVEVVTDKSAWQELSTSNFTPLVTWSFDLDLALGGPNPSFFYAHQILSIVFTALCLRLLMIALGAGAREGLIVALLFLATPPTVHVAGLLMTRHYVEGLLAAVLSTLMWVIAVRGPAGGRFWLTGSVAFYLIALMSKEVFILLPLVLIALTIGRERWKALLVRMVPFIITLLVYLAWRSWILESGGGYGGSNPIAHLVGITGQWVRSHSLIALWFGISGAICAMSWLRSWTDAARCMFIGVAVCAPLVGLGDAIEGRHLLFPAVAVLSGAVGGIGVRIEPRWRTLLMIVLLLTTVVGAISTTYREEREIARMEAEGRYVWQEDRDATMLLAGSPAWYLDGLVELDAIWRKESSPDIVFSELGAFVSADTDRYLIFADDGIPRIEYLEDMRSLPDGYLADAPLALEIRAASHELQWTLGPQCECGWRFYSYPDYQSFEIPRTGARVVPRPREQQWFRIERRMESGEWTLSPPLPLPRDGEKTMWKRGE